MLYTIGEEIFNSVSHGVGAIFSIVALTIIIIGIAIIAKIVIAINSSMSVYPRSLFFIRFFLTRITILL